MVSFTTNCVLFYLAAYMTDALMMRQLEDGEADLGADPITPVPTDSVAAAGPASASSAAASGDGSSGSAFATGQGSSSSSGHSHHSVFRVHLNELDSPLFWYILIGMFVVTVFVDRMQAFAAWASRDCATMQAFLARVYAELMMFGVVAISLFVFSNISDMTEETHLLFEFVDIWCSFGACSLILVAAVIFWNFRRSHNRWAALRSEDDKNNEQYKALLFLADAFKKNNDLDPDFDYFEYMDECAAQYCVGVMSVDWKCWLVLCIFPVAALIVRSTTGHSMSVGVFLTEAVEINWLSFALHMMIWLFVSRNYNAMNEGTAKGAIPDLSIHGKLVGVLTQLLALVNMFCIAFFFMAGLYNSKFFSNERVLDVEQALPLFLSSVVVFPSIIFRAAVLQGYYEQDPTIIGSVIETSNKIGEDLTSLREAWVRIGKPNIPEFADGSINRHEFPTVLQHMKLFISKERQNRLFNALDTDRSNEITMREFYTMLTPRSDSQVF